MTKKLPFIITQECYVNELIPLIHDSERHHFNCLGREAGYILVWQQISHSDETVIFIDGLGAALGPEDYCLETQSPGVKNIVNNWINRDPHPRYPLMFWATQAEEMLKLVGDSNLLLNYRLMSGKQCARKITIGDL